MQTYRTLRVAGGEEGLLSVVIDAPPMNLIGPELVRDLVTLPGADAIRADARRFQLVVSDAAQARTAALFAQGLQTRGPLELGLGDRARIPGCQVEGGSDVASFMSVWRGCRPLRSRLRTGRRLLRQVMADATSECAMQVLACEPRGVVGRFGVRRTVRVALESDGRHEDRRERREPLLEHIELLCRVSQAARPGATGSCG